MTLPFLDASLVLLVLALAIIVITALAITGRWSPRLEDDSASVIDLRSSAEPVTAQMLRDVRFTVTLRGYRMAEVDALLERIQWQWEQQSPVAPAPRIPDPEVLSPRQ